MRKVAASAIEAFILKELAGQLSLIFDNCSMSENFRSIKIPFNYEKRKREHLVFVYQNNPSPSLKHFESIGLAPDNNVYSYDLPQTNNELELKHWCAEIAITIANNIKTEELSWIIET
jgi:hypothetical protein